MQGRRIGDYIHFRADNYYNYGLNKDKREWNQNLMPVYKEQIRHLRTQMGSINIGIQDEEVKELEAMLNGYLKNLNKEIDENKKTDEYVHYIENTIDAIEKEIGRAIDFGKGGLASDETIDYAFGKINKNKLIIEEKDKNGNIIKKLNKEYYKDIKDRVDKAMAGTFKEGKVYNQKEMYKLLKIIKKIPMIGDKTSEETYYNAIKGLNEMISDSEFYGAWSKMQGDIFENIVAHFARMLDKNINELDTYLVGGKTNPVQLNSKKFSKSISSDSIFYKSEANTQQKTDVIIHFKNKKLKSSLKNINLGDHPKAIGIVSGSSLAFLLQNQQADFVTHYLNLHSHNFSKRNGEKDVNPKAKEFINQNRDNIYNYLLVTLAFVALTGQNFNREAANFFIINDRSQGKIRCFTMTSILNYLIDRVTGRNGAAPLSKSTITANKDIITKIYNNEKTSNSPELRIANIIREMHDRKINVTIGSSVFTDSILSKR